MKSQRMRGCDCENNIENDKGNGKGKFAIVKRRSPARTLDINDTEE